MNLSQFRHQSEIEYIGQNLYIRPTYIVSMPEYSKPREYTSEAFQANKINLQNNHHNGKISAKAMKEIKNAVSWLIASAKFKTVYHKPSKKLHSFKVNFITLTMPDQPGEISDKFFKEELLNPWLSSMRANYGLKNYVWKLEFQKNGLIHCHLTTDSFIHYSDLKRLWNARLRKSGLLKYYQDKFRGCTFEQYLKLISANDQRSIDQKKRSWEKSTAENWNNPNTTDVHSVRSVKDLPAYVAKYMAKDDEQIKKIKGRIWGCNYELSRNSKPSVFIPRTECGETMQPLMRKEIEYKPIINEKTKTGIPKQIGEMFFLKPINWLMHISGTVKQIYTDACWRIRNLITEGSNSAAFDLDDPSIILS